MSLNSPLFQYIAPEMLEQVGGTSPVHCDEWYKPGEPCSKFSHCHEDAFQQRAEKLAGQLLFPQRLPTDPVMFSVHPTEGQRGIAWLGENRLGGDTARDLLHLFHHLDHDVFFKTVCVSLPWDGDWQMNPVAMAALLKKSQRIRAYKLHLRLEAVKAVGRLAVYQRLVVHAGMIRVPELLRVLTETEGRSPTEEISIRANLNDVDGLVQVRLVPPSPCTASSR